MTLLRRLLPSTIPGQMMLVILFAIVAVVTVNDMTEPTLNALFPTQDMDAVAERTAMLVQLMSEASADERAWLLQRASRTGLEVTLMEPAAVEDLVASSSGLRPLDRVVSWFFPPDADLPLNGRWVVIEGRRALAMPVDPVSVLVARDLPDTLVTDDFIGPLTYYVLAFVTLLVLFSLYAARTIAGPIDRIVAELDRTDGVAEERTIAEEGTVEVVKLARALNEMRGRIRGMVEMRMRMLRSVSHDLRTPLTRLRMRAERLDDAERRSAMIADIERIDALVTGTLDYLRIDPAGEAEERVDLASLLQTVQADFADVGFDVRYEGPDRLTTVCKPNALARAVTNLCDNAVKFGQSVAVSLTRAGATIRIDVADDGPGIPADKRPLVTEPFFKLDAARGEASNQGFGLGLSIVTDIVRAHGAALEFHDRAPHGLIARIVLPERSGSGLERP